MGSALCVETAGEFAELGLLPSLCQAVHQLGFTSPTPIQRQAIAALLRGDDVLGQAATGTGKTAAFGLPMLQRVIERRAARGAATRPGRGALDALVLVPTRELAIQVAKALGDFAAGSALRTLAIYGGQDMRLQLRALTAGANVVVATPGRLIDHLQRRSIDLSDVNTVVLDEADEMLDRGFADDLADIFSCLPTQRQTAMFSATLSHHVTRMAQQALHEPVQVRVSQQAAQRQKAQITHLAYLVPPAQRAAALSRLLSVQMPQAALIFCRTRADVDVLCQTLSRHAMPCEALHGGMQQAARDKVMRRFTRQEVALLVATDVAARGLDIDHISHVINYDMPESLEVYMHRVGRTGRAGRTGVALSLVHPGQRHMVQRLKSQMGVEMQQAELPSIDELADVQAERSLQAVKEAVPRATGKATAARLQDHAAALAADLSGEQLACVALHLARHGIPGGNSLGDAAPAEIGIKWSSRPPSHAATRPPPRSRKWQGGPRRPYAGPPRR